jgi:hypothetical protein
MTHACVIWVSRSMASNEGTVAVNLAFEAAAAGREVLLVDADTYGGAVAHANIQEHHKKPRRPCPSGRGRLRRSGPPRPGPAADYEGKWNRLVTQTGMPTRRSR